MISGTTPTHVFKLPFDSAQLSAARVVYKQGSKEIIRKETKDFTMEGNIIKVNLTQEDTFLFDCKTSVKYQLRVRTVMGRVLATKVKIISVEECLDREVLL